MFTKVKVFFDGVWNEIGNGASLFCVGKGVSG